MIISGKVVKGLGVSTKKGFPTANINIRRKIPKFVYIAQAKIEKRIHQGILIVGAPTKHKRKYPKIEFFCLTKKNKCYGKNIEIKTLKKIRLIKKFNSQAELINQIKKDVKQAIKYFKAHG